jgi:hypothetical protein
MTLLSLIKLVVLAVATLVPLYAVGAPLRMLILGRRSRPDHVALTPLLGLGVLQLLSFLWATHSAHGLRVLMLALPALGLLTMVGVAAVEAWRRRALPTPKVPTWLPIGLLLFAATTGLFVFHHRAMFDHGRMTVVSLGNNDISNYAAEGDHLRVAGLHQTGPVLASDFGAQARRDVFGAYAFITLGTSVTGRPAWRMEMPALLAALFLCVQAMYWMVRRFSTVGRLAAVLIALAACTTYASVYVQGEYFLSQVIGMAVAGALLLLAIEGVETADWRVTARTGGAAACLGLCLMFTYPHMLFLSVPIVVGIACLATLRRPLLARRSLELFARGGAIAVTAIVIPWALSPARFVLSLHRTFTLSNSDAGWPLPLMTPAETIGFQRHWNAGHAVGEWAASAAVLIIPLALAAWLWRGRKARTAPYAACLAVVAASYEVVYLRYGFSYSQWKWITFFQPLYIVSAAVPVVTAVLVLGGRRRALRPVAVALSILLPGALLAVDAANARVTSRKELVLASSITELQSALGRRRITSLNINVQPYWETMWSSYFAILGGVRSVTLQAPSYYPTAVADAEWTLRRADDARPLLPGREAVPLTHDYQLVHDGPPPAEGSYYVLGDCGGLYRYVGGRWTALERAEAAGEVRLRAHVDYRPGTRSPVLQRGGVGAADTIGLEQRPGRQVVFFLDHWGRPPVEGVPVPLPADGNLDVDAVLDQVTNTARVTVNGRTVLDPEVQVLRLGEVTVAIGSNTAGSSLDSSFPGTLAKVPIPTPKCQAYRAGRPPA